jgi:G3E family GTPase
MKVTINVVTGILGAGKTSVLRHLIDGHNLDGIPGVVVGEYAKEGFDGQMLKAAGARVAEITNTGRGDSAKSYVESVRDMIEDEMHWRIYLETSGVTQISQVAQELLADPLIGKHAQMGRTVTVLDAGAFSLHDELFHAQLWAQVAVADVVVINKTDKLQSESLSELRARIHARRPGVTVQFSYMGQASRPAILDPLTEDERPAILDVDFSDDPPAEFEAFVYRSKRICFDRVTFGHRLLNLPGGAIARFKGALRCWDKTHCLNGFPGQLDWDSTPVQGRTAIAFIGLGLEARRAEITAVLDAELESQQEDDR